MRGWSYSCCVAGEAELVEEVGPHALERRRRTARGEVVEHVVGRVRVGRDRRTADIASAAAPSGTASGVAGRSSAAKSGEPGELLTAGIHRPNVTPGTFVAMYPGAFVETQPDKPAIVMASTGAVTTFAELDAAANRLSRLLRQAGVQPGDHVAFCMENHPRYLEVAWGCHYAGAIYTACSSRLTSGELSYILNDCEAKVFITSKYKADQAAEIVADTPGVTLRLMLDGTIDGYEAYEPAVAAQSPEPMADLIAGTDMLYSSGTTGMPKGVAREFRPEPLETNPTGVVGVLQLLFARIGRLDLPLPRPAVPRRPAALLDEHHRPRRHGRRDGALRRRGVPGR